MDDIQELRERKARLTAELELIDQYLAIRAKLFPAATGENVSGLARAHATRPTKAQKNDPSEVAKRAEELIRAHGKPLQRGELVRRIEASGMPLHTADKGKYIGTILWRQRDKFVNVEGEGYWIVGLPVESAPKEFSLTSEAE